MDTADPMVDPVGPEGAGDPLRAYRSWATALFALLAALIIVVGALALGALGGQAPLLLAAAFSTALLGLVVLVALVIGLGRLAPWAIHAIQPVCVILIAFGVLRVLVGFAAGTLTIPLEAIGAALVLSRDHRPAIMPPLDAGGRRTMWLATGAFFVAQALPLLSVPLQ
jgi:hypothetical protein